MVQKQKLFVELVPINNYKRNKFFSFVTRIFFPFDNIKFSGFSVKEITSQFHS